jgi:glycosyltransferase involved in cell wall biosynthesis
VPITLAVPTYNQAGLLRAFLAAWRERGADLVPLLVVDDGSSDETPQVLRDSAHPRLAVHRLPHVSAAHARNHALRASPTAWLAFTDTDCILSRGYFETLASLPDRFPQAIAVEGAVRPVAGPKPPFTHSLHNPGGTYATANMAFRAAEVLALGGFDEAFTANFREDTDLALTLLDRGHAIPFWPELVVEHPHLPRRFLPSLAAAYATQDRLVRAEIRLYAKHPASYGRVRHCPDARGTLSAWRRKYFALYLKECFRYLFRDRAVPVRDRLRGLIPAAQAMAVALAEQACIVWLCMVKWREAARLKGS